MYTVYSSTNCNYCSKAKQLLIDHGFIFEEINAKEVKDALVEKVTGAGYPAPKTVPQIFKDDQYIGGYTELAATLA